MTSPDSICVSAAAASRLKMFVWIVLHVQENKIKRDGKGEQMKKKKDFKYLCFKTLREAECHHSWPILPESDATACISRSGLTP